MNSETRRWIHPCSETVSRFGRTHRLRSRGRLQPVELGEVVVGRRLGREAGEVLVVRRDFLSQGKPATGKRPEGVLGGCGGRVERRCCAVRKLTRNAPYPQTR